MKFGVTVCEGRLVVETETGSILGVFPVPENEDGFFVDVKVQYTFHLVPLSSGNVEVVSFLGGQPGVQVQKVYGATNDRAQGVVFSGVTDAPQVEIYDIVNDQKERRAAE